MSFTLNETGRLALLNIASQVCHNDIMIPKSFFFMISNMPAINLHNACEKLPPVYYFSLIAFAGSTHVGYQRQMFGS